MAAAPTPFRYAYVKMTSYSPYLNIYICCIIFLKSPAFPGNKVDYRSGRAICIKTYRYEPGMIREFEAGILLIRHPYQTIVSEAFIWITCVQILERSRWAVYNTGKSASKCYIVYIQTAMLGIRVAKVYRLARQWIIKTFFFTMIYIFMLLLKEKIWPFLIRKWHAELIFVICLWRFRRYSPFRRGWSLFVHS